MNRADPSLPAAGFAGALRVVSLLGPTYRRWSAQLTEHEKARLGAIGEEVRLRKGQLLYQKGDPYDHLFLLVRGILKTFSLSRDGRCTILAFLFPEDLAGLGEEGLYANAAEAVTDLVAIRMPTRALENVLRAEAHLEMLLLCKACNELRASQQHAIMLSHRSARERVMLFLHLLARRTAAGPGTIDIPMGRADIAGYLGLSVEAVSRAFHALEQDGVLALRSPRKVAIADPVRFHAIADELD